MLLDLLSGLGRSWKIGSCCIAVVALASSAVRQGKLSQAISARILADFGSLHCLFEMVLDVDVFIRNRALVLVSRDLVLTWSWLVDFHLN